MNQHKPCKKLPVDASYPERYMDHRVKMLEKKDRRKTETSGTYNVDNPRVTVMLQKLKYDALAESVPANGGGPTISNKRAGELALERIRDYLPPRRRLWAKRPRPSKSDNPAYRNNHTPKKLRKREA